MKRKALGKGLSSLIPGSPPRAVPSKPQPAGDTGLIQIDIDRIRPNHKQPRDRFDEEHLRELARSLQQQGVLQPVVVRPAGDGAYELVAGERRWRAAQIAGLLRLPAVVRNVSDDKLLELALIENLQREELNPIETANAYQMLIDELHLEQQELADRVGKPRSTIANSLRLLNLPVPVQELIRDGRLTAGHAKPLASLTQSAVQVELARKFVRDGVSVRQAEALVARLNRKRPAAEQPKERDPNVMAAEERLQRVLGTKTRIVQSGKKGRLEIHFFSEDELQRIFNLLLSTGA